MPDLRIVAEYECVVQREGRWILVLNPAKNGSLEREIVGAFPNGARLKVTVEQVDAPTPIDEALRRTA